MVNKRHQDNKNHETGLANEILPPATPMSRTPEYRREYQARYRARKKAEAAGLSLSPLSTPTLLSNNSGVVCLAGKKPTITSNSPVVLDKDATNEPSASTPGVVSLTGNKTTITSNSPVVVNENTTHQNNKYHEAGLVKELLPPATPMSRTPEYRREYQARYRARKKAEAAGLSLSPLSAPILLSNNSGLVCLTRNKSTITSTSPVVVDRDATGEPSASTPGNSHLPHIGAARSNLTDTVSVLDVNKGRLKYQREYRKRKKFDENSATEGMLKKRRETYALSVHGKDSTLTNNGEYQHERRSQSNNEMSPSIGAEQDLDQLKPDIYELGTNDDDGARVKSGHDVQYKSYRVEGHVGATGPDPYEHVFYKLPNSHHVLEKAANCTFCRAKRFTGEGSAFCCRKGKVLVHIPEAPAELRRLFTSQTDKDAIYFRKHIRHFNSHFSFTSLGASLDRCVSTAAGTGIYTFRVQGQVYHYLDQLVPGGSGPRHMQLYFYDTEDCVAHRISRSPNLDAGLIRKILDILRNNPYVHTFKSLGSVPNLDDYKIELNTEIGVDQRRYNAPTVSQVAAIWMDGSDPRHKFERSIMVYGQADRPFYIKAYHGCYDPLAYPLFFPCGEVGWNKKILYADGGSNEEVKNNHVAQESTGCNIVSGALEEDEDDVTESTKYVSPREYYCFKLQIRDGEFNILFHGGRLFQQFLVDVYIKIESMRLDWYSKPANQAIIRADLYQGIVDTIAAGEARASETGRRIVLPKNFPGSDRDVQARYLDATTLVQRFGKPDYFITMTCNPYWDEITQELLLGQTPQDRAEIVIRVYKAKLRDMEDFLIKKKHFGEVAAYAHVTEFQKRGLPHEHFLLIMAPGSKLASPDDYDKHISAEIPDKKKYPKLHDLVCKHMMHGPCGTLNKKCPCMIDGQCRFRYPRQFCEATQQGMDSYPIYRRRDDGQRVEIRHATLDNRWVVPYNPILLMRYNCHINVEICSSIKAVKYLYKYIYKGHDRASFSVNKSENDEGVIDEIKRYRDARCITPPDAACRLYGFPLYYVSPPVLQMQVHLPGMHMVAYRSTEDLNEVVTREKSQRSMLTEYFKMNVIDPNARKFLYREFPEFYVWKKQPKIWKIREKRTQIGRMVYAHPAEGERFYLRILLSHVRGATSYIHLRTVQGVTYPTFREACENIGFVETDDALDNCMTEAATWQMPYSLRRLFATIMIFCEATNIRALWDKHFESMSEDYSRSIGNTNAVQQMVLMDIYDVVKAMGKDIRSFGLPELDMTGKKERDHYRELTEELSVNVDKEHLNLVETLNSEQLNGFNEIMGHVRTGKGKIFFVDGPGGTGKTYLYKALLATVRSMGLVAIATATSGIAASIMPGGRTAHSRFKIPIKIANDSMCNFTKQSGTAELLRRASLIIWDEVAMTRRQAVETLDRSLQDIMGSSQLFGGKIMIFGGDFRQVLPVVARGTRAQIIDATLQRSYLWEHVCKIRLTQNMRAQSDPWFSDYLLRIGDGTEETIGDEYVRLPEDIVIDYSDQDSIDNLIKEIFPDLVTNGTCPTYMSSRAILSTKNEYVDTINSKMIDIFSGKTKVFYSFDSVDDDLCNMYPIDFLNSLTPNGLPPHELKVKINCPVILLRNLDPNNGLCNGTRLMVKNFQDNVIDAEIVGGQHAGKRVFIPRIPLSPSEDLSLPFKFKRKQFPLRLSFGMTINKAQGQTIPNVGIYLPEPVFAHGQLYVALSRGVSLQTTKVLAKPNESLDPIGKSTKNIVYKDVLQS